MNRYSLADLARDLFSPDRVAWTLIHFLWQGLAITLVLALIVRLGRVQRPTMRYACSLGAFFLMILAPVATLLSLGARPATPVPVTLHPAETRTASFDEPIGSDDPAIGSDPALSLAEIDPTSQTVPGMFAVWLRQSRLFETGPHDSERRSEGRVSALILAMWILGVAVFSLRLMISALAVSRLRRQSVEGPAWLVEHLEQLVRTWRMPCPRLAVTSRLTEAVAVGIVRPVILLPAAWVLQMPPDMVVAVIAHELAHLRRHDVGINLLQRCVETLLFYHPAVWWLSRRLRYERELCCDALVVELTRNPLRYAETLEHVGRLARHASTGSSLVVSVGGSRSLLIDRVRHVLQLRPADPASLAWSVVTVPLLGLVLLGGATTLLEAAPQERESELLSAALAVPALDAPTGQPARELAGPPPAAASELRVLVGRLIDAQNQPLRDHEVALYRPIAPERTSLQKVRMARTGVDGSFQLAGVSSEFENASVWCVTTDATRSTLAGWAMRSARDCDEKTVDGEALGADSPDRFVLRWNSAPGKIQIDSPERQPVAGAKVSVTHLLPTSEPRFQPVRRGGLRELVERRYDQQDGVPIPAEYRPLFVGRTDAAGAASVPGLSAERVASIEVETERYGLQTVRERGAVLQQNTFRFQLSPVGRIEGTIRLSGLSQATGFPLATLRLNFRTTQSVDPNTLQKGWVPPGDGLATVQVDQAGRFSVPALAQGALQWQTSLPDDSPFVLVTPLGSKLVAEQAAIFTLDLVRKVRVEGTVRIRGLNTPVTQANVLVTQFQTDPYRNPLTRSVPVDASGRFTALVRPGLVEYRVERPVPGLASVFAWESDHPRAERGLHHEVTDTVDLVTLPGIELVPTKTRTGTLIDAEGRPVTSSWEVLGVPANSRTPSAVGPARDQGRFLLEFPETVPPVQYAARKTGRWRENHAPSVRLIQIQSEPLILQLPGSSQNTAARPVPASRSATAIPADPVPQETLETLRCQRRSAHDRQAAADRTGRWKLTLPRGFVYELQMTQRADGFLVLSSPVAINLTGVFSLKGDWLELIETENPDTDFRWERQTDGSFRLQFQQHSHGANYTGAILRSLKAGETASDATPMPGGKPPAEQPSRTTEPPVQVNRPAVLSANDLIGDWKMTVQGTYVLDVKIRSGENGQVVLTSPSGSVLMGTYAINRERLVLVDHPDGARIRLVWQPESRDIVTLTEEHHPYGATYRGTVLTRQRSNPPAENTQRNP